MKHSKSPINFCKNPHKSLAYLLVHFTRRHHDCVVALEGASVDIRKACQSSDVICTTPAQTHAIAMCVKEICNDIISREILNFTLFLNLDTFDRVPLNDMNLLFASREGEDERERKEKQGSGS